MSTEAANRASDTSTVRNRVTDTSDLNDDATPGDATDSRRQRYSRCNALMDAAERRCRDLQ
jgi:uncharacterized protein RhaS with RHS repeats